MLGQPIEVVPGQPRDRGRHQGSYSDTRHQLAQCRRWLPAESTTSEPPNHNGVEHELGRVRQNEAHHAKSIHEGEGHHEIHEHCSDTNRDREFGVLAGIERKDQYLIICSHQSSRQISNKCQRNLTDTDLSGSAVTEEEARNRIRKRGECEGRREDENGHHRQCATKCLSERGGIALLKVTRKCGQCSQRNRRCHDAEGQLHKCGGVTHGTDSILPGSPGETAIDDNGNTIEEQSKKHRDVERAHLAQRRMLPIESWYGQDVVANERRNLNEHDQSCTDYGTPRHRLDSPTCTKEGSHKHDCQISNRSGKCRGGDFLNGIEHGLKHSCQTEQQRSWQHNADEPDGEINGF